MTTTTAAERIAQQSIGDINILPDEVLGIILSAVPCLERIRTCKRVCKRWYSVAFDDAAVGRKPCVGPLDNVQRKLYILNVETSKGMRLSQCAAFAGHLDCLRYGRARGDRWDASLCLLASHKGHLHALQWLVAEGCPYTANDQRAPLKPWSTCTPTADLARAAIEGNRIDCLDHATAACGIPMPDDACLMAARYSHVNMLRHLHAKGCAWDDRICQKATERCNLECLAYAHRSGLSIDGCDWFVPIRCKHHAIIRYALENGWVPTQAHLLEGISHDAVQCVAYMIDAGLPFKDCDWSGAIGSGHVSMIEYALDNGWVPTQEVLAEAVRRGHRRLAQCLVDRAVCSLEGINDACLLAAESRSTSTMDWLRERACAWDERVTEAAVAHDDCNMLRHLRDNGCPWDWHACMAQVTHRRHSCNRYLRRHRPPSLCRGSRR